MSDEMHEAAARLGSRGGYARARNRKATISATVAALPTLQGDTVDQRIAAAKRSCELIRNACVSGALSGSQGNAAIRAVEIFLRIEAQELELGKIKQLTAEIARLEKALAAARGSRRG